LAGFSIIVLFLAIAVWGQAPAANPPQDPLMTLLLSQPKIEIGSAVTAIAWFDPPVVRPGQLSFYRVTFNALEESIEWPKEIAAAPKLELRPGARGQFFQPTGSGTEPRTTFSYRAKTFEPGETTIPAFTVQVYGKRISVPAARLQVDANVAQAPAQQLILDITNTNLFVGQPVSVRVLLPSAAPGLLQVFTQMQLVGQGFIMDQGAAHQKMESMMRDGSNITVFIHDTMLIPVVAGKVNVFAQAFTVGQRIPHPTLTNNPATLTPTMPQFVLIESESTELSVKPLPRDGELPGFTGAIGTFSIDQPKLATNSMRVGDPVKLSVTVHATGFSRLVPPPAPKSADWQVLAATPQGEPAQMLQTRGVATFDYTLIPMSEGTHATPLIPFCCFEPSRAAYTDLTIPSLPITVLPGRAPVDMAAMLQSETNSNEIEEELTLSGLANIPGRRAATLVPIQGQAWFPAMQIAPIAIFLGLLGWERRRRYLETHPQILVRRRARRALRRERRTLRRAAQGGNVSVFAASAVRALRIGSAPHFPAEPGALVAGDILQLFRVADDDSRQPDGTLAVVRRFFAITDASRFSLASANPAELLILQPEIERVLAQLEARL